MDKVLTVVHEHVCVHEHVGGGGMGGVTFGQCIFDTAAAWVSVRRRRRRHRPVRLAHGTLTLRCKHDVGPTLAVLFVEALRAMKMICYVFGRLLA